jgi:hypothetical protein
VESRAVITRLWPVLLTLTLGLATRPRGRRVAHWLSDPLGDVLYALGATASFLWDWRSANR